MKSKRTQFDMSEKKLIHCGNSRGKVLPNYRTTPSKPQLVSVEILWSTDSSSIAGFSSNIESTTAEMKRYKNSEVPKISGFPLHLLSNMYAFNDLIASLIWLHALAVYNTDKSEPFPTAFSFVLRIYEGSFLMMFARNLKLSEVLVEPITFGGMKTQSESRRHKCDDQN
ncbi:Hypothetical predicted protein [Octopus vulgaris]|uniref:Uncharacterized protein n=1 Tax=Octopus vulgaris TaxID=6645 RepID=A0AA36BNC1_OCTVU|nr:Hypothetical predicted protein [Octopus vulgaris]